MEKKLRLMGNTEIKNLLIDIDGVLSQGNNAIEGAKETIEFLNRKMFNYLLVTNTTRMSKQKLIERLAGFGIKVDEKRVLTALTATVSYIKSIKENAKCYLIAPDDSDTDFKSTNVSITRRDEPVDFVVLGYDSRTNFEMLDTAFGLINNGANLVAMHEDRVFPSEPRSKIGLGAFVRSLEYSTGKNAVIVGKPNRNFFELSMKQISASTDETAMVGDSLLGDIGGAQNIGLKTIMVRTGNFNEKELADSRIKPDYIINSIKDLPELLINAK